MPKLVNKIIKILITGDFFLNLGWGLLGPVFAIFIVKNIETGGILEATRVAGFASLAYWATKAVLQIPIGRYLDKNHGEKDDFWFMVIGEFIAGLIPLGYLIASEPWHIYTLQIIYAAGMSMAIPSWYAIFTRHVDKGKEALQWSLESVFFGAGAGIAGGVGGVIASIFGFKVIFIMVSILSFVSVAFLLMIRKDVYPKVKQEVRAISPGPFVEP